MRSDEIRARWLKECDSIGSDESDLKLNERWNSLRNCVKISVEEMRQCAANAEFALCPGNDYTTYGERLRVMIEVYTACADELEAAEKSE